MEGLDTSTKEGLDTGIIVQGRRPCPVTFSPGALGTNAQPRWTTSFEATYKSPRVDTPAVRAAGKLTSYADAQVIAAVPFLPDTFSSPPFLLVSGAGPLCQEKSS
jgi:hypothetical protein